jgi:sulfur carrier protein ThiS adenylyltransferase
MIEIFIRNVRESTELFRQKTIGIAGCGGLGSNAAVALVRAGIGKLVLADFDKVEFSNLNRQYFFKNDIGKPKVQALANHLQNINPEIQLILHPEKLTPDSIATIFKNVDVLIEAFDAAESKKWLIETWCKQFPNKLIVSGSGLSGIGKTEKLEVHRAGNLIICGDETTQSDIGLCSARIAIVANMQANEALAWLWEEKVKRKKEKVENSK